MDLELLYNDVAVAISKLDFDAIWPGFAPLKFALYDDNKCFFDGRFVEKTDAFCANTSIVYNGEQIAIWMVSGELETAVLTSKIVHEMFHGFQRLQGWDCWPDELEALVRYEYDAENLGIKLRENELLLAMTESFDSAAFSELMSLRSLRREKFPYQFSYEVRTEEIEGTANYVEWQVLMQLNESKAHELTEQMRAVMTKPEHLFPIRISCYYTGALVVNALVRAGVYSFDTAERPAILPLLKEHEPSGGSFPGKEEAVRRTAEAIDAFRAETENIVRTTLEKNEIVLNGPLELVYVNIYNARCYNEYLTSTFFVMYKEGGEDRMLPGNFVIKMRDGKTIDAVYKWA
ncbi:MAG: hypothetical protein J5950_08620 [Clostridia bacterium]|nr:hypothetical protein [Clostridia bacterium]